VRKLLVAFGILAVAGPAFAIQEMSEDAGSDQTLNRESFKALKSDPRTVRVRLDRSMGDQLGPNVDVGKICGQAGARQVEVRRTVPDVLATFFTVGFYTPAHGYVLCK